MRQSDWGRVIEAAMGPASRYLESLPERAVYRPTDPDEIRSLVGGPLPEHGTKPEEVVATLARDVEPFLASHASGRYFGFVIGGLHPAAYGAELLVSTWDQNAGLYAGTPGVSVVEEVAAGWLLDLLDLPGDASVGFVTGGQMANFTCLAAARNHVLRDTGWDVEADGLQGAPKVHVVVKTERHSTIPRALRYLGLGGATAVEVPCDEQSRIDVDALEEVLSGLEGPTIVCLESGDLNTGSFDPFDAVADAAERHRDRGNPVWVHGDGAVGLWARASQSHRYLTEGLERLDSWSTDAHKLLNCGYDSGIAITRHPAAHRAAMSVHASYLIHADGEARDPMDWNPEFSRRARGLGVYATIRSLGRSGVADLVDRTCSLAKRFATRVEESDRAKVMNEVVFNQVLVQWLSADGDHDAFNDRVVACIQADGTAFLSGTTWGGKRLMRISVSDWASDENDVDRAIEAMLRCADTA
ncbi:MAG: aminotransferase class V-fold PLP-dependent enzyme [Acidimicrobiia bacterium]|nr:MAG: aminotransferase class V-fold PLP-dependent enzyme [Acidimicrobiia bacterium]